MAQTVLALKLLLVPGFLLLISLAGRRWGPTVAGLLAGLPVVAGPIVWLIAIEQDAGFAASASAAALSGVFATVAFYLAYAHATVRFGWTWWAALVGAFAVWFVAAGALSWLPGSTIVATVIAAATLAIAPHLFPVLEPDAAPRVAVRGDLAARMLAGALLTLAVTQLAAVVGARWSGLFALFPVLGSVLAVYSHRGSGAVFAATLLRAMTSGLWSLASFFVVLAVMLPASDAWVAFAIGAVAAVGVQAAMMHRRTSLAVVTRARAR